jgi:hypothetical protein
MREPPALRIQTVPSVFDNHGERGDSSDTIKKEEPSTGFYT